MDEKEAEDFKKEVIRLGDAIITEFDLKNLQPNVALSALFYCSRSIAEAMAISPDNFVELATLLALSYAQQIIRNTKDDDGQKDEKGNEENPKS